MPKGNKTSDYFEKLDNGLYRDKRTGVEGELKIGRGGGYYIEGSNTSSPKKPKSVSDYELARPNETNLFRMIDDGLIDEEQVHEMALKYVSVDDLKDAMRVLDYDMDKYTDKDSIFNDGSLDDFDLNRIGQEVLAGMPDDDIKDMMRANDIDYSYSEDEMLEEETNWKNWTNELFDRDKGPSEIALDWNKITGQITDEVDYENEDLPDIADKYLKKNGITEENGYDEEYISKLREGIIGSLHVTSYSENELKDLGITDDDIKDAEEYSKTVNRQPWNDKKEETSTPKEPVMKYTSNFNLNGEVNDFESASAYLQEDDMTKYVPEELKDVISKAEWILDDEASGHINIETTRELTEDEQKSLKDWIDGQNSDGLGEGFEQQDFAESYYNPDTGDGPYTYGEAQEEVARLYDEMDESDYAYEIDEDALYDGLDAYLRDGYFDISFEDYLKDNGYIDDEQYDELSNMTEEEIRDEYYDYYEEWREEELETFRDSGYLTEYVDEDAIERAKQSVAFNNPLYNENEWHGMASITNATPFTSEKIVSKKELDKPELKAEDYMKLHNARYGDKIFYNKDENREMTPEELAEDFMRYHNTKDENYYDYLTNLALDKNSNVEIRNKNQLNKASQETIEKSKQEAERIARNSELKVASGEKHPYVEELAKFINDRDDDLTDEEFRALYKALEVLRKRNKS